MSEDRNTPYGVYSSGELLCVLWNDDLAARFPHADHTGCRQMMQESPSGWVPYDPPRCHGWHCPRCGAPTNGFGHHHCTNPTTEGDES